MNTVNKNLTTSKLATPLSEIRTHKTLASKASYQIPLKEELSEEWIEGRRHLDNKTQFDLVRNIKREDYDAVVRNKEGAYFLPPDKPIPIVKDISYRLIGQRHMWIAIQIGAAVILDNLQHEVFIKLVKGKSPLEIINWIQNSYHCARNESANQLSSLVDQLSKRGFIKGITDLIEESKGNPRRFMRIHLTQSCNLACAHCYADSSPIADISNQLNVESWKKIINKFANGGGERVLFTGGEALHYRGCDELLLHSKKAGLETVLFTNGVLVEKYIDSIKKACDLVQVSIDGIDAESNDPIRGHRSFERAITSVEILVKYGVAVRISSVIVESNFNAMVNGFDDFAAPWVEKGVEFRLGNGLSHHGRGLDYEDNLNHEQAKKFINQAEKKYGKFATPEVFRKTSGCGYAEQVVVAQDGNIHPCHLLDGSITNFEDQSYEMLLDKLDEQIEEYSVDNVLGCNQCDIKYICGGGCRVQNGRITGNRRLTACEADDKMRRLINLADSFG